MSVIQQMDLTPTKREILEVMLLKDKPASAAEIAIDYGKKVPPVIMHLIWLARTGHVDSPEKGQYAITEKGKEAIGIRKLSKEVAKAILARRSNEEAFHFYACIGNPLECYAHDLQEFSDELLKVSGDSLEFHLNQGHFEAWFAGLGDLELAKKTALLKEKKMVGEELRKKLHEIVENRRIALATLA